ncbi:putative alanine-tRNA ligase/alanyl-tRNA synthetase protein [Blattamonas nauphoetae]|uniref:Alanine-tRNA ligase/alanyl-tRNA synthetase protein n=1 Tax=Blattamonas nauphoetae TaxID=2049346 RepID=A0ABQ9X6M9_9EUKA|nr:putative alanine-tRNA ligase/alanyl-tRNA synthetase protein [Blattamonas nauphoetae]
MSLVLSFQINGENNCEESYISFTHTVTPHTAIDRYPVVARWRDDVDYVAAGIFCFQPYCVTDETACYKVQLIENNLNWLTTTLHFKETEITFNEDVWTGGGNMGLCTESFVKGLEVGNMVFNVYKADHVKRTNYPTSNEDMSVGSTLMQLDGCFTINHSLLTIIELAYQRWNPTDQAAEIIVKNSQNTGQKEVQMKAKGGEQLSSDLTVYDLDHTHYHARDYGNNDEVSPLNTTLISCPTQESTSKSGQDHDNGKLTLFLAKPEGSRFEGSFAEILADRTAAVFDVVDVGKAGHCVTHQIVTALTEQHIHHKSDGPRVWQASAKKTVVQAHLDITHFAALKEEEVEQIEDYANKLVTEELVIRKTHMKKEDVERQHGFSLYQGGVVPGLDVRVVSMLKPAPKTRHQNDHLAAFHSACPTVHDAPEDDVVVGDVKACCGLHLHNSAQVRSIRILCSNCGL